MYSRLWRSMLSLNCFRRDCYYQWVILSIMYTKRMFLFSVEKGAPSVLYRGIYFKDCWHEVRSSLKYTPPVEKAAYAPALHKEQKEAAPRRVERDEEGVKKMMDCFSSGLMIDSIYSRLGCASQYRHRSCSARRCGPEPCPQYRERLAENECLRQKAH